MSIRQEEYLWVKDYRFPISRGMKTIAESFAEWASEYLGKINNLTCISGSEKNEIKVFCDTISKSLEELNKGNYLSAHREMHTQLDLVKKYFPTVELGKNGYVSIIQQYYRINSDTGLDYTKKRMLHIPFDLRHKVGNFRYSTTGMPCTYMSSDKSVCWYECNMPKSFYLQEFIVNNPKCYKLLKLDINPIRLFMQISGVEEEEKLPLIKNSCFIYPLLTICSYAVNDKDGKFFEEYQIPQILMSWIKLQPDIIGTRFYSCSKYGDIRNNCGHNIAIPTREIDADGYCGFLKDIFRADDTSTNKYDTRALIHKYEPAAEAIKDFYAKIKYEQQHNEHPSIFSEIIDVCEVFISNYEFLEKFEGADNYPAIITLQNLSKWAKSLLNGDLDLTTSVSGASLAKDEREKIETLVNTFKNSIISKFDDFSNIAFKLFIQEIK